MERTYKKLAIFRKINIINSRVNYFKVNYSGVNYDA